MRRAAPLGANLNHAAILPGRSHHGGTFHYIHSRGLLHIDIRPSLDGIDHRQCVPMIRSGDEHHIQILFLQHLAVILVETGHFFGKLAGSG